MCRVCLSISSTITDHRSRPTRPRYLSFCHNRIPNKKPKICLSFRNQQATGMRRRGIAGKAGIGGRRGEGAARKILRREREVTKHGADVPKKFFGVVKFLILRTSLFLQPVLIERSNFTQSLGRQSTTKFIPKVAPKWAWSRSRVQNSNLILHSYFCNG